MTEKERLVATLFSEGRTINNIKFCLGDDRNITEEDLCRQANAALEQVRNGTAKPTDKLDEDLPTTTLAKFLA